MSRPASRTAFAYGAVALYAAAAGLALWLVRGALSHPTAEHLATLGAFAVLSFFSCTTFLKATLAVGCGGATMGRRAALLGDAGRTVVLFLCLLASLAVLAVGIDPCTSGLVDCRAAAPTLGADIDL